MIRLFILITAMSSLLATVQATLAASVIISPTANGSYSVQGDSMDGVAGIDLTIKYDSNSLSSPTVNQGSLIAGALMVDNTNNPGSINIAIISSKEFSGSGQIATVTFASQSGTGGVTSASISMIDSNGAPIAAQVTVSGGALTPVTSSGLISTPGIPFSQSSSASTATSSLPTSLGTVSMPMDASSKNEAKHVDTTSVPVQTPEPATVKPLEPTAEVKPIAEPQMPMELKATTYKGAIENFRVYRGEKSPAIYVALIKKQITSTISQVPIVVLSDGNTPVKLLIKLEAAGDKSPNFSLNGAKLVSLTSDASSTWIIDALPQIGIIYATLTILTDRDIIEYPLTLAPPVKGISPVETDFTAFLNGSGVISPKRDLNGDGSHDYLDDFIYTANYLVNKAVTGKIKKSETALTSATLFSPKTPSADGYVPERKSVYYTLLAGETVNRSKLNLLLNKLKSSGFQPVVREENKTMDVFRLVTECFSAKAAAQKSLTDLARHEKHAFMVHDANKHCIAAASFFSYDAVLTGQNRFTQKNIRTEIVKAQVPLTTWQVTVGSYNDSQSAAAELKRLAELGIDVVVVPRDIYTANYLISKDAASKIKKSEPVLTADAPFPSRTPFVGGIVPKQKRVFYTLSAGETVSRSKLGILIKKLEASGLQPVVREENKTMDVFRLVTECFSAKAAAQKRLTDLARKEKKAFIVHDAEQSCVVAASFFSYDAALAGQNRFTQKNIRTEIVKAQVSLTTWQVTVGSYNESQSATAELKRLAERGIDVVVVPLDK